MKTFIFISALGATAISAAAFAQAPGAGERGGLQRDQTRAEAQQRAGMMFQMLDANKDGTVTRAEADQALKEFEAMRGVGEGQGGGRMQRMLDQAFGTAQSLTLQQFEGLSLTRFDAMDLNHDGTVTPAEREQVRAARQGQVAPVVQPTSSAPGAVPSGQ